PLPDSPDSLRPQVPLAPLTTLGVGGEARFFLDAATEEQVDAALDWADKRGISVTLLGGGSNVLVSDRGVDGLVVRVRVRGIEERDLPGDPTRVVCDVGAGEELDRVVVHAIESDYGGLECLSGIPGYIGATPIQNVGAYGQEIADTVIAVRVMDRTTRAMEVFDNASCRFTYRNSVFKAERRDRYVILGVTLALTRGGAPGVHYPEIVRELSLRGGDPRSLADVRAVVLAVRRSKSMVIDAADPNRRSVGSFFVNPMVTLEQAGEIEQRGRASSVEAQPMPRYPVGDRVKLSAAWLIERSGFAKGTIDGAVGISTRHALAIVNRGGASSAAILGFARRVRDAVIERFGVALAAEPVLIGFSEEEASALR
ncbi:MAG TPA: UDP-N-acetylmuramate dehydrogenase, partial [Polyangiaceae bacterium]|nr:UDP-N-acetylmuramate dehydrogenase [Polyangiaceae bacterium]